MPEKKSAPPVFQEKPAQIASPLKPAINWEQFMGARLFAWIGGLALFLGVAFFVKYSFERNLIPPELRVAIGFLAGLGLVAGGVALKRKENVVTAHTLCATGILILYAVTFACRSFYHFPFFGLVPTFFLMSLITVAAFLLAVRLDALVVAILGIAGGFLTPILLSTGQDNPAGLFGYIALLDIGLLLVAARKDWASLPILGAVGTVLMEITWVEAFFVRGQYFAGTKILIPMAIFAGFAALFCAAAIRVKSAGKLERATSAAALATAGFAMIWAFYFLSFSVVGNRPTLLFTYLFVVDVILLLAFAKSHFARLIAPIFGAVGTVLMEIMWVEAFFVHGQYFAGTKILIPMAIFSGFAALFCAVAIRVKDAGKLERVYSAAALAVAGFAMLWAFSLLSFSAVANRPALLFSYLFVADVILLLLAFAKSHFARLIAPVGIAAFLFLGDWTCGYLNALNLYVALGAYFVFAVIHSATPLVMQRLGKNVPPSTAHLFPAITLLLVLLPIFQLGTSSLFIWPLVLCVDLLALFLAMASGMLAAVFVVLFLTFLVLGAWIVELPSGLVGLPFSLALIGGFAVFFTVATTWMARRVLKTAGATENKIGNLFGDVSDPANFAIQLPALSATLPFLLLIMATLQLPLINPSPVFGVALVLIALLLGMTKIFSLDLLACVALVSIVGLEHAWHVAHFTTNHATVPLLWYLGFAAIFTIFPFLFHRQFASKTLVWASSALALPLHFFLVYDVVRRMHPNGMLGLVPAAFAVPLLLALVVLLKRTAVENAARTAQLALFGGAALFFITLIFPIQFDRQWITIGWALEGVALFWLFHRVPHPGLRIAAIGLLVISFARLALNPAVLSYHARAATPIFNWYLYTYGVVALSLFA
ncbi:MAG: DUF2339 domain-containing protein, partial [Verrucomicrobiota bacterium]|nr:DUF2339 domain-containing protein [Verrucomicrobiota bacterium]